MEQVRTVEGKCRVGGKLRVQVTPFTLHITVFLQTDIILSASSEDTHYVNIW